MFSLTPLPPRPKIGRPLLGEVAMSSAERVRKHRAIKKKANLERVAILDMETDPFDKNNPDEQVLPFLAVLYAPHFEPIIIWDDDYSAFASKVVAEIEALPDEYTIYAHNGGKFDYMFLLKHVRGEVQFKGRGVMSMKIGKHTLRDSFHIIPERLANIQKDAFDYKKNERKHRGKYRDQIIAYCINDCKYLYGVVIKFLENFGFRISIGQASVAKLRENYKIGSINGGMDKYLRQYFFGGRVECLAGVGHFRGAYKLYDVNSMYPYVMASMRHPISNEYEVRPFGKPTAHTAFIQLQATNRGALVRRGANNETSATERNGVFFTSIHEYWQALELDLIRNVKIMACVDNAEFTDFSKFVVPLYNDRMERTKPELERMRNEGQNNTPEYHDLVKDDMFTKFLLNNGYGKLCQNPRRFKEHYITAYGEKPPQDWFDQIPEDLEDRAKCFRPSFECSDYAIWERPNPGYRFLNVGTGASITGGSRSVLLRALYNAEDPIYCDTDSVICRDLPGETINKTALGAWDIEKEYSEVIIAGKKSYAAKPARPEGKITIKLKGASGAEWKDFEAMLRGEIVPLTNEAPTLLKTGHQFYMMRNIRATATAIENPIRHAR